MPPRLFSVLQQQSTFSCQIPFYEIRISHTPGDVSGYRSTALITSGSATNLDSESERLTLGCRVTWTLFGRGYVCTVDRYLRYREQLKLIQHIWGPYPFPDSRAPVICNVLASLSSALLTTEYT